MRFTAYGSSVYYSLFTGPWISPMDDRKVAEIVEKVVARLRDRAVAPPPEPKPKLKDRDPLPSWRARRLAQENQTAESVHPSHSSHSSQTPQRPVTQAEGIYNQIPQAAQAAQASFEEFTRLGFGIRFKVVEAIRRTALENLERWSR